MNNNDTKKIQDTRFKIQANGFSALEMLLVLGLIVLLLGAAVLVGFRDQPAKNRNTERRNEVNSIKDALTQWSLDTGIINSLNIPPSATCIGTDAVCYNLSSYLGPQYLSNIPEDPKNTQGQVNTGYTIERDPVLKVIIIKAPSVELDETNISATFSYGGSDLGEGGVLSSVTPSGASAKVSLYLNGTGFDPTAANNEVSFVQTNGSHATSPVSSIATIDLAMDLRRLTLKVPEGLPTGSTQLIARNKVTGMTSKGVSMNVTAISLPGATSGARGSTIDVQINGEYVNFVQGFVNAAFGSGITKNSTTVLSPTNLIANITISSTATTGVRTIGTATNTTTTLLFNAFTIY